MNRYHLCYLLLCSQGLLVFGVGLTFGGELHQRGSEHSHRRHLFVVNSVTPQAGVWGSSCPSQQNDHHIATTDVVLLSLKPEAFVVIRGINDTARHGLPRMIRGDDRVQQTIESKSSIHQSIRASNLPDATKRSLASIQSVNEFVKGKCQHNGNTFLGLRSQLLDATGHLCREFTRDGMHLNTQAYREWARAMLPLIAGL